MQTVQTEDCALSFTVSRNRVKNPASESTDTERSQRRRGLSK